MPFVGSCAFARGPRTTRWGQAGLWTQKSKRQEDSVLTDSFIRKISEAKAHMGILLLERAFLLKNFYKWKRLQVQAIFKNTTTWVAGRRVTAVFKYFSEGMNTRPHSAVPAVSLTGCVGLACAWTGPAPFRGLCDLVRVTELVAGKKPSSLEIIFLHRVIPEQFIWYRREDTDTNYAQGSGKSRCRTA